MANYKRGKCRKNCPRAIRGSMTSWRADQGLKPIKLPHWSECDNWVDYWPGPSQMMNSYPAWWDRTFHVRPFRAAVKRIERSILKGADPDEALWPVWGKPHIYYW